MKCIHQGVLSITYYQHQEVGRTLEDMGNLAQPPGTQNTLL